MLGRATCLARDAYNVNHVSVLWDDRMIKQTLARGHAVFEAESADLRRVAH